jgi:hypothetical protein
MTRVCEILGGPRDGDLVADVGNVFTTVELTDTRFWSYGESEISATAPVGYKEVAYRKVKTYDMQCWYVHPDYYRWATAPERRREA